MENRHQNRRLAGHFGKRRCESAKKIPTEAGLLSGAQCTHGTHVSHGNYFFAGADLAADPVVAMKLSKFCSATRDHKIWSSRNVFHAS